MTSVTISPHHMVAFGAPLTVGLIQFAGQHQPRYNNTSQHSKIQKPYFKCTCAIVQIQTLLHGKWCMKDVMLLQF